MFVFHTFGFRQGNKDIKWSFKCICMYLFIYLFMGHRSARIIATSPDVTS